MESEDHKNDKSKNDNKIKGQRYAIFNIENAAFMFMEKYFYFVSN